MELCVVILAPLLTKEFFILKWSNITGCFLDYVGAVASFEAIVFVAMKLIDIAYQKDKSNLWLECDFPLVVAAYKSVSLIPLET